jgi:hypothetical protein
VEQGRHPVRTAGPLSREPLDFWRKAASRLSRLKKTSLKQAHWGKILHGNYCKFA